MKLCVTQNNYGSLPISTYHCHIIHIIAKYAYLMFHKRNQFMSQSPPLGGALSPQGSPPLGGALSPQGSPPLGGVTAFWASPRFGHPHSHIPSVLGIPGGGCPKR